jgi:hypothetical protein
MARISTGLTGVSILLVALSSAEQSFAQSDPPDEKRYRFDIGGRIHLLMAENVAGLGAGADLGYRALPALSVGLFVQLAAGNEFSGDECAYSGVCFDDNYRFGAAAALHPVQDHPLDPWLGVTAGPSYYYTGAMVAEYPSPEGFYRTGWSFDLSVEAGLDVRLSGPFGVGLYFMLMPPLTDRPFWKAIGLRVSSSF